ncbi:MAG: hypothetical protein CMN22_02885 [Rubrivirga sp.]|nr:hypothetical protein [Rubrivirga sp.]
MRNAHGAHLAGANLTSASLLNADVSHVTFDETTMPNASRETSTQYLQRRFLHNVGATAQPLQVLNANGALRSVE